MVFLKTMPEQSLQCALDCCPAGNSSHDNPVEDHGSY